MRLGLRHHLGRRGWRIDHRKRLRRCASSLLNARFQKCHGPLDQTKDQPFAVALKDIAGEVGGTRSIPALASALAWLGSGAGGIMMGHTADRIGTPSTVICGGLMIGLGLAISTLGLPWPMWIGHGLFIGLNGLGGINALYLCQPLVRP